MTDPKSTPHFSQHGIQHGITRFTDQDIYLYREGTHNRLFEKMGSHITSVNGVQGTYFAVWAPNAKVVSVIGNFNGWNSQSHVLAVRWDSSGIWEGFVPGIGQGELYKYCIQSQHNGYQVDKIDPFVFFCETPPKTASIVWDLTYTWNDQTWMRNRYQHNALDKPMAIYELHFGSWRRRTEDNNRDRKSVV